MKRSLFITVLSLCINGQLHAQASEKIDSLLSLIESGVSDIDKVNIWIKVAEVYGASDSTLTVSYSDRAIELADQIDFQEGKIDGLYMKAALCMTLGHIDKAASGFQSVVDQSREIGYKNGAAKGLNGLGATRDFRGDYAGALNYLFQALKINEEVGDKVAAASRYNNIGLVYYGQEDYPNATKYLIRARNIYKEIQEFSSVALVNGNLGDIYIEQNHLDSALRCFNEALKLYIEEDERFGIAVAYRNLADIFRLNGQIDSALYNYALALNIFEDIGGKKQKAQIYLGIGIANIKLRNWSTAKEALNTCLSIAREINHPLTIRDALENLALVENKLKNYTAALKAQSEYKDVAELILNTQQTKILARVEAEYEFQKERDSIAFERKRAELALESEIEEQKWIKVLVIIIAAFLAIIVAVIYRSYLIKRRKNLELKNRNEVISMQNQELTTKNTEINNLRASEKKMADETIALKERELTTVTMLSHEKNSLLQQLGNQIGELSGKVNEEVLPDIKEIKRTIKSNLSQESWSMFMYQFEKVHPVFFNELKTRHSAITQNDLRLCAYIKVGMDNKEIAQVANITLGGVKKSINRLKKKIDLPPGEDLREFLLKI